MGRAIHILLLCPLGYTINRGASGVPAMAAMRSGIDQEARPPRWPVADLTRARMQSARVGIRRLGGDLQND